MKLLIIVAILSFLVIQSSAQKLKSEFRNFSHKGLDYKTLDNLRFLANDITFSGVEQITILGKSYLASKYSLTVNTKVQTLCAIGPRGGIQVYEQVPAIFEIYVTEDRDRSIHDTYLKTIFDLWSRKELFSGEYFFDFDIKGNNYIFSWMPNLVNVDSFYYVWVNEFVVKVVFKEYKEKGKGGWGMMDSFTEDNFRIRVADSEFSAYKYPLGTSRKRFLDLYKKGVFKPLK